MPAVVEAIGPSQTELEQHRAQLGARAAGAGNGAVEALRELADLDARARAFDEETRAAELEGLVHVHEAMGRLRDCPTAETLIEEAPRQVRIACGFSRAMISRVRGSIWVPSAVDMPDDARADDLRDCIRSIEIPLDHALLETEMVRRRVPLLVVDPQSDPGASRELVGASRSESYVAAPIMPTRRVIGFLHADRFGQARACDERDRDVLCAFAEHFGLLFERLVLVERLEAQREKLREVLTSATDEIDEVCRSELALVRRGPLALPPSLSGHRSGSRIETLLTPREREVLDLLVSGRTNAEIAQRLVVSEGTVKSHLKRILRKLHVTNRAEAVAKYLHLVRLDESRGTG